MEQLQVLIVDEEDSKAEPLRVLMENNGFLADKETDPRRVRTRVRQSNYDIILLDIVMPDYDGIDVLVDVKTFSPSSKIIMMTGFATRTQIAEAMRLGASAFCREGSVSVFTSIHRQSERSDSIAACARTICSAREIDTISVAQGATRT